uniref:AB hydrolase-1 domain-containing protein n=1 Tax=Nothoprocta perdicaria TaxID=30464 RepID=A0A8C7A4X6_NOTPE
GATCPGGSGTGAARRCRPAWRPRLRTLLLDAALLYLALPFLIRLFPALLTKFVFLNFRECRGPVAGKQREDVRNAARGSHGAGSHGALQAVVARGRVHTVPGRRAAEARGKDGAWFEAALGDAHPVIIYLHGNGAWAAARGAEPGTVLAGYGDSSSHPSESGFTTDVLALYDWAKARSGDSPIIFWGHSLGTGWVPAAPLEPLCHAGTRRVDAVVLESPYTNIRDAAAHVPITKIYRQFPGFEYLILDSMARGGMFFRSDENVKVLSCPLLILHAEDDAVLPPQLGRQLFEAARGAYADKAKVKLVTFPEELGLGHDYISSNPELPALLGGNAAHPRHQHLCDRP